MPSALRTTLWAPSAPITMSASNVSFFEPLLSVTRAPSGVGSRCSSSHFHATFTPSFFKISAKMRSVSSCGSASMKLKRCSSLSMGTENIRLGQSQKLMRRNLRPRSSINFVAPHGSRISRLRGLTPSARDSTTGPSFLSMTRGLKPRRASSTAAVRPTGPAPATSIFWSKFAICLMYGQRMIPTSYEMELAGGTRKRRGE